MKLTLYGYFRSSAAYRVRLALLQKGIVFDTVPVHLMKEGGRHKQAWFAAINPQMRVPALAVSVDGRTEILTQSMAILEWLEETYPQPALLPREPIARAKVRAFADLIACDIHPINNLAQLAYLKGPLGQSQAEADDWYRHWISTGFKALETLASAGPYCFGSEVTLADICLAPQMFNARRFDTPLEAFPKLVAIDAALAHLPAFHAAQPGQQPDAE